MVVCSLPPITHSPSPPPLVCQARDFVKCKICRQSKRGVVMVLNLNLNVGVSVVCVTRQTLCSNTWYFLRDARWHIRRVTAQTACLTRPCTFELSEGSPKEALIKSPVRPELVEG